MPSVVVYDIPRWPVHNCITSATVAAHEQTHVRQRGSRFSEQQQAEIAQGLGQRRRG